MGRDVAKDSGDITVRTMGPIHQRGPVFYASLPLGKVPLGGQGTNGGAKDRLISLLWDHARATESPVAKSCRSFPRGAFPIRIAHDPLGKPLALWEEHRGPAVSFSEGGGELWAALCGDDSAIGIDVAGADEFPGEYPVHRVFHDEELHQALMLAGGHAAHAAALLWSIKEAVAKALGCAFHLVDPREIAVHSSGEGGGADAFSVSLSQRTQARFPNRAGRPIWVRSLPLLKTWLSICLLDRQQP
jgi:phosphopantetheinyl transferase (holo-ACP synthase)